MNSFYFRAVASDGQLRTGTIHAETERFVARELRRQGLTPVYVGSEPKKSFELKLPSFSGAKRKDVLFFTHELSTLLNAGVPLDRALSITLELTDRPSFRILVQDVLRVLKGGKSLADSLATHPEHFSELYINMVRAGEAGGSLAVVSAKAGPSGSAWIDTNTGFIRSVRAWGHAAIWLGNLPPEHTIVPAERYLQALADAALSGGRWVLALDEDFAGRLRQGEAAAVRDWKRIAVQMQFCEGHPEWRGMQPYGKLAIVQDPADGGLLSGGILDMIAARHTPVRPIPRQKLAQAALRNSDMAVDVDPQALTPDQKEILKQFTRAGGTLLTAPAGWKEPLKDGQITLSDAQTKRLDGIWHDVQQMIGRRNLGARLFNVSSMLSNLLVSDDRKQVLVELVNYSSYPVDSVTVHVLGEFHHARVYTPEGGERAVEIYKTEEGSGVDIDKISVCATLRLD